MPPKLDQDTSPSVKMLRVFRKLLLNGQRHYQTDLASEFQCSPQTIIRIMNDIESVIGINFESGLDNRRKWYRIKSKTPLGINMQYEELRYLSVCRDLAGATLPRQILSRVDDTIFNLSLHLSELGRTGPKTPQLHFYSKGRIDYTPFFGIIDTLIKAIEEKRVCLLLYKAAGKSCEREHLFAPHCLVSMNQAIYLLGAILEDGEVKHFTNLAVHRIRECEMLDERFAIDFPDSTRNFFGLPWHEPKKYRIHFNAGKAANYISERIWSDAQKMIPQEDGSLILEIITRSGEELLSWIRSFGDEARLLSGPEDVGNAPSLSGEDLAASAELVHEE